MIGATQIRFGKHEGLPLSEVPTRYLTWPESLPNLRLPLRSAVGRELESRRSNSAKSQPVSEVNEDFRDWLARVSPEHGRDAS